MISSGGRTFKNPCGSLSELELWYDLFERKELTQNYRVVNWKEGGMLSKDRSFRRKREKERFTGSIEKKDTTPFIQAVRGGGKGRGGRKKRSVPSVRGVFEEKPSFRLKGKVEREFASRGKGRGA